MRELPPMTARRSARAALLLVAGLAGCGHGDDYPADWPAIAHTWGCPTLVGQWRVGGKPGIELGALGDVAAFRVLGETRVPWEAVAISAGADGRLKMRLVRSAAPPADPLAAVPAELHRYVDARSVQGAQRVSEDAGTTRYDSGLRHDGSTCIGSKRSIGPTVTGGGDDMFLAVDREGNLVAERVHTSTNVVQLNAGSPSFDLGHSTASRWAHWPAMTAAEFDAVESAARDQATVFDLGPVHQGTVGAQDVEAVRQEATAQLEAGAKVVALRPVGAGAVLATIEAGDVWGIRRALERLADAHVFEFALRRYDPTRPGAIQADVLLARHDGGSGATPAPVMPLGEAQAAVLASMPDSIVLKSLAPSSRGFRLMARADDARAVATLLRALEKNGRFVAYPASTEQVTLGTDGTFALELTPRR